MKKDIRMGERMKPCEMCDGYDAKRREDNLYVCDECNKKYPKEKE